jgi:MOSC domain-containing protein YiiM
MGPCSFLEKDIGMDEIPSVFAPEDILGVAAIVLEIGANAKLSARIKHDA